MGMDANRIFTSIWQQLAEKISEQRRTKQTESCLGTVLLIEQEDYMQERYFDWKVIPITNDQGDVMGAYGIPSDRTGEVIISRQNVCIHQLSRLTGKTKNMQELWLAMLDGLSYDQKDIPFALLYSLDEELSINAPPSKPNHPCHFEGAIGLDDDHCIEQEYMDLVSDVDGFTPSMLAALKNDKTLVLEVNDPSMRQFLCAIGCSDSDLPCKQFAIVPFLADDSIAAFMVVGLNPYRRYDEQFRGFLHLITAFASPQIMRTRLSEEVARHNELAQRAQLDRRRSEMRFSRFADRSIAGLAITDTEGKILYANDAWYKFSGLSPADQANLSWSDSVIPEDVGLLLQWQKRVVTEKKGGTFQIHSKEPFRRGHVYSEYRTGICACYSDLNELGEVESVMILTMDISELKWTEQQLISRSKDLEESEDKWRNYAEHCPFGICRTDGDGFILFGNDAWRSFFGVGQEPVTECKPWIPWIHEDYAQEVTDFFGRLQTYPGPETIEFQLVDNTETILGDDATAPNGAYVLSTGFTRFKENGEVDYIDFWIVDISGQKMAVKVLTDKMEEAIRSRTQQEHFMDMISHEIRNPLSAVLHCSEEIIESVRKGSEKLNLVLEEPRTPDISDPMKKYLKSQISNVLDAANTIVYCVQHQKQIVDDVLTISKLDSDLLMVSPIPMQPMALVRLSLKIFKVELKMTNINLTIVEDSSLSTLGIEWVLLDPTRFLQIVINLVTNAIKFTKQSKVREIVVTISAHNHRPLEEELGVEYVPKRYSPATPVSATGQPLDFEGAAQQSSDIFLSFTVQDTGKGLTNNEKAQVFDRFAQASPRTHVEYGGSGLGLFISRQITEMLDGEIGMASSPGSGCTFAFYVKTQECEFPQGSPKVVEPPLIRLTRSLSLKADGTAVTSNEEEDQTTSPETPPNLESAGIEPLPLRILVVEDNLVNQKVLCKQLRNHNFGVKAANHGRDALDVMIDSKKRGISWSPFDVILCDIEMPVMDGIEFTREIRRLEAKGELVGHIPILGVTANVRSKQVSDAIEVGMDGVTTKPYHINELIANIGDLCAKH